MATEEELLRWGADWSEQEARRAQDPVLGQKALRRWEQKDNWQALIRELYLDERAQAAVVASLRGRPRGGWSGGQLVLTDRRLLFVNRRLIRRPLVISIDRTSIGSMSVHDTYPYASIHVETADDRLEFRLVPNNEAWNLMGHWLAALDAPETADQASSVAVEERPPAADQIATTVSVSQAAHEWITASGGALYLWQKPFNKGLATDKLALDRPPGIEFAPLDEDAIVHVAVELPAPGSIEVDVTRWPLRRIKVLWDGERWGRRGVEPGGGG